MSEFNDKVAIVTGASSGFGRAVSVKLAKQGAKLALVDINEDGADETLNLVEEEDSEGLIIKADVSSPEDVKDYVQKTVEAFGQIDLFFNNAGIIEPTKQLTKQEDSQIDKTIDINLKGVIFGLKYVLLEMEKNGSGAIVNTSSGAGLGGNAGQSMYSASKHGVIGMTKSVAKEVADQGIRTNTVAPGSASTAIIDDIDPDTQSQIEASIPMGRQGSVDEIADAVMNLFSEQASYATGSVLTVDGGIMA